MDLQSHARQLRKSMTPQEVRLWSQLKILNRHGYYFRRQAPVDGYILDFAEFSHRLIIEVDGSQHGFDASQSRDAIRDRHFGSAGFRILRFWNSDVDTNMDGVIDMIISALKQDPHPSPFG
ncbi:MAG: endonuclease domain-containing protein [Hyphomicrobiales bacterium]